MRTSQEIEKEIVLLTTAQKEYEEKKSVLDKEHQKQIKALISKLGLDDENSYGYGIGNRIGRLKQELYQSLTFEKLQTLVVGDKLFLMSMRWGSKNRFEPYFDEFKRQMKDFHMGGSPNIDKVVQVEIEKIDGDVIHATKVGGRIKFAGTMEQSTNCIVFYKLM